MYYDFLSNDFIINIAHSSPGVNFLTKYRKIGYKNRAFSILRTFFPTPLYTERQKDQLGISNVGFGEKFWYWDVMCTNLLYNILLLHKYFYSKFWSNLIFGYGIDLTELYKVIFTPSNIVLLF